MRDNQNIVIDLAGQKDLLIYIVQDSENEIFSEILTDALHRVTR
jgi:hypothetical protein